MMQRFATILLLSLSIQYSATLAESSNLRAGAGSHANYADPSHEGGGRELSVSDWWGSLVNMLAGDPGHHSKGQNDDGSTGGGGGGCGGCSQGATTQDGTTSGVSYYDDGSASTQDGSTQDGTTSGMSYYDDGSVSYGGGGGGDSDGATAESSNTQTISYEQYAYVKDEDSSNSNRADGSGSSGSSKNGAFVIGALVASVVGAALVATMNKNRDDEDQENSRPLKARMGEFVAGVLPMKKKSGGVLNEELGVQASPSFVELARVPSGRFNQSKSLSVDDDDDDEGRYEAPPVVHQLPGYKAMP